MVAVCCASLVAWASRFSSYGIEHMVSMKGLKHMKHLFPHRGRMQVGYAPKPTGLASLDINAVSRKPKKSQWPKFLESLKKLDFKKITSVDDFYYSLPYCYVCLHKDC